MCCESWRYQNQLPNSPPFPTSHSMSQDLASPGSSDQNLSTFQISPYLLLLPGKASLLQFFFHPEKGWSMKTLDQAFSMTGPWTPGSLWNPGMRWSYLHGDTKMYLSLCSLHWLYKSKGGQNYRSLSQTPHSISSLLPQHTSQWWGLVGGEVSLGKEYPGWSINFLKYQHLSSGICNILCDKMGFYTLLPPPKYGWYPQEKHLCDC